MPPIVQRQPAKPQPGKTECPDVSIGAFLKALFAVRFLTHLIWKETSWSVGSLPAVKRKRYVPVCKPAELRLKM